MNTLGTSPRLEASSTMTTETKYQYHSEMKSGVKMLN